GPAAIPALSNYLNHLSHASFARVTAANDALTRIAKAHPETRHIVVEQLTKELSRAGRNDPGANGFIIAALIDLRATEAAEAIKAAFYADKVDPTIAGDWYDVREELGLDPAVIVPGPDPQHMERGALFPGLSLLGIDDSARKRKSPKKAKNKRK